MTNLLAIGLTASLVAKIFGFGANSSTSATMWQTAIVFGIFVVLSIPLGLSLRQIASDAVQSTRVRRTLNDYFSKGPDHVYGITLSHPDNQPISVEALVLVQKPRPQLEHVLQMRLQAALHDSVQLTLSQIPSRPNESASEQAISELKKQLDLDRQAIELPKPGPDIAAIVASKCGLPLSEISADRKANQLTLHIDAISPSGLAVLRTGYSSFQKQYPSWGIAMIVNPEGLPAIYFKQGSAALDGSASELVSNLAWLFKIGGIQGVSVIGFSDTAGLSSTANRRMARNRATAVAEMLEEAGLAVEIRVDYPVAGQRLAEREMGLAQFRKVKIVGQR